MRLRLTLFLHEAAKLVLLAAVLSAPSAQAQVPQLLNYQGRVQVGATDFTGSGQFKFALVNGTGSQSFWSNDGTSVAGSQPTAPVSLQVNKSLYAVLLGDTAVTNMTAIPAGVFANPDVRLRVWFNDGPTGFQQLAPDHRVASVGYAMMASAVPDGAISANKLAPGAVTANTIAAGAIGSDQLAEGAVTLTKLASAGPFRVDSNGVVYAGGFVDQSDGEAFRGDGVVESGLTVSISGLPELSTSVASISGLGFSTGLVESFDAAGQRTLQPVAAPVFEFTIVNQPTQVSQTPLQLWFKTARDRRPASKSVTIHARPGTSAVGRSFSLSNCWPVAYELILPGGVLQEKVVIRAEHLVIP